MNQLEIIYEMLDYLVLCQHNDCDLRGGWFERWKKTREGIDVEALTRHIKQRLEVKDDINEQALSIGRFVVCHLEEWGLE